MLLKPDCRHFPGDRPCRFNKESGQTCDDCPHYKTAGTHILIIKLAALGDVLRTTVILPGIKAEFPDSAITWLTMPSAVDLLKGNPLIDELWALDPEASLRLGVREFDVVFSPDADPHAATLAAAARAPEKRGMILHPRGHVVPASPEAETWFEMGAFDHIKKANKQTYQELIYQTLKLPFDRQEISLSLTDKESSWAESFLAAQGRVANKPLLGLNLGGGGRWKKKRWKKEHFITFGRKVVEELNAQILLIGGHQETQLLEELKSALPDGVMSSGADRTLRETASLIGQCAAIVTGDSLALHVASALRVPTVVLLGPTSSAELEMYDRGEHVVAPIGCVNCYLTDCDVDPDCMQLIDPNTVLDATRRWLK